MINKTIALLLMLPLLVSTTLACSCIYYENTEAKLKNAEYIFTGEVVNIQTINNLQEVTVRIINHWKPSAFPESVNLSSMPQKIQEPTADTTLLKTKNILSMHI
ncbi:hypothetical protein FJZ21_00900 [Candidatus Pacearchaeota archaeon]|nr:hypothetical protein [Candidatus Pacearchaeota archaeon]